MNKKWLTLATFLLLLSMIAACGGDDASDNGDNGDSGDNGGSSNAETLAVIDDWCIRALAGGSGADRPGTYKPVGWTSHISGQNLVEIWETSLEFNTDRLSFGTFTPAHEGFYISFGRETLSDDTSLVDLLNEKIDVSNSSYSNSDFGAATATTVGEYNAARADMAKDDWQAMLMMVQFNDDTGAYVRAIQRGDTTNFEANVLAMAAVAYPYNDGDEVPLVPAGFEDDALTESMTLTLNTPQSYVYNGGDYGVVTVNYQLPDGWVVGSEGDGLFRSATDQPDVVIANSARTLSRTDGKCAFTGQQAMLQFDVLDAGNGIFVEEGSTVAEARALRHAQDSFAALIMPDVDDVTVEAVELPDGRTVYSFENDGLRYHSVSMYMPVAEDTGLNITIVTAPESWAFYEDAIWELVASIQPDFAPAE